MIVGLHVTGKYRDENMMHTCARHAAWVPHSVCGGGVDREVCLQSYLLTTLLQGYLAHKKQPPHEAPQ